MCSIHFDISKAKQPIASGRLYPQTPCFRDPLLGLAPSLRESYVHLPLHSTKESWASTLKNGFSHNTKCDNLVGFPKLGHIQDLFCEMSTIFPLKFFAISSYIVKSYYYLLACRYNSTYSFTITLVHTHYIFCSLQTYQ